MEDAPFARFATDGLTFDDVSLVPRESEITPDQVDTTTQLTRDVTLAIPIVSAAMDTVTEAPMAIAMARNGGIGILHRNMSIEAQAAEVDKVKRSEAGMVINPVSIQLGASVAEALSLMAYHHIGGVPVVTSDGHVAGIVTNRDLRFEGETSKPVAEVMTGLDRLVTVPVGTDMEEAKRLFGLHRIEKLPVVDGEGRLAGLITVKDLTKASIFPHATKDAHGRLRVGAAVGVGVDAHDRAKVLYEAGADVIVVDTAHGHSAGVRDMVRFLKESFEVQVVAGNVSTGEGAVYLADAGADAVKIGQGPGSICTTRVVAGVGVPQITAIVEARHALGDRPVCLVADGGIRYSGDIAKALAAGADTVMIGGLLGGTDEAPGDVIVYQGERFKDYRGMGSLGAMDSRASFSKDRYGQEGVTSDKLVPEGVEGRVSYKGQIGPILYQLVGGLRSSMGYLGAVTVAETRTARFVRQSHAALVESHPHDIQITKTPANYRS